MSFTEEQLRMLLSSDNGRTVGRVILDSAGWGRKVLIAMHSGITLRLCTSRQAEAVLRRLFRWPGVPMAI
jgi:hypothetical protein